MEYIGHKFFENFKPNNEHLYNLTKDQDQLQQNQAQNLVYHHYLLKSKPQRKIKFFQLNKENEEIANEHILVAELLLNKANKDQNQQVQQYNLEKTNLLSLDIEYLLNQIQLKKVEEESQRSQQEIMNNNENLQHQMDDEENFQMKPNSFQDSQLWIDKYTSYKFFDLLSDEATNRNVLTWLKSWDELVYPENGKLNLKTPTAMMNQSSQGKWPIKYQKPNFQNNQAFAISNAAQTQLTPEQIFSFRNKKILLLHGPPGTGKSTLAKVLAKHCKYKCLEVNASDERTGEQILGKIKNALQMNSLIKGNQQITNESQKPVCLIIDEVDGAIGSGSYSDSTKGVQMIVEYLKKCMNYQASTTKKKSKLNDEDNEDEEEYEENEKDDENEDGEQHQDSDNKKKIKKNVDIQEIKRPIIFICNDHYVKAIRPLKEIALVVKVGSADPERLLKRLRYICQQEKVQVEDSILQALCRETNYDTRSCINTLQFVASVQTKLRSIDFKTMSQQVLKNGQNIMKDSFESIFQYMEFLMHHRSTMVNKPAAIREVKQRFFKINDSELVNDALYQNYQNIQYYDDDLERTSQFLDLLSRADEIETNIKRTQNYEMKSCQYMPGYFFKRYCAGNSQRLIDFPKIFREFRQEKKKNEQIFETLLDLKDLKVERKGVKKLKKGEIVDDDERYKIAKNTTLQTGINKKSFMYDVLPYLNQMLYPNIREINTQLFSRHEKEGFQMAIEMMVMFDIKLNEEENASMNFANINLFEKKALFEPDICSLTNFGNSKRESMREKTKVLIMQNYEGIKQRMLTSSIENNSGQNYFDQKAQNLKKGLGTSINGNLNGFGFLSSFVSQNQKKRKRNEISQSSEANKQNANMGRFVYKFKEGHSKNFKRVLEYDYFI